MKYLQRLFALLAVTLAIFSCQKEYSLERPQNISSYQWQFTEGSSQYKGPVDTATIDTFGNLKVLTVSGHSTDGRDQISLIVNDSVLKVGTYKTPYSQFDYARGAAPFYQTNQLAADSFTIVLTKIDSIGVAGTFSGVAYDTTNTYKKIVNGSFAYSFKATTPVTPTTTDSGQVLLWAKASCDGSTNPFIVNVNGVNGTISKYNASEPADCASPGSYSIKLPVGTYPWVARCGNDSIGGSVTVIKNGCTKVLVDFSTLPGLSLDYFPMTTGSNWTGMYDGANIGDTTFTYVKTSTLTVGNNKYSIFGYADYQYQYLDTFYYRKANSAYYQYYPAASNYFGFDNPTAIEYEFLDTSLAVNTTFNSGPFSGTINGIAVSAKVTGTILEKDPSVVVAGITYKNVIKVRLGFFSVISGVPVEEYRIEQWYARGIGLVEYKEYLSSPFTNASSIINTTKYKVN